MASGAYGVGSDNSFANDFKLSPGVVRAESSAVQRSTEVQPGLPGLPAASTTHSEAMYSDTVHIDTLYSAAI